MQQIFCLMFLLWELVMLCSHDVIAGYVIVIVIARVIAHAIVIAIVHIVIVINEPMLKQKQIAAFKW